MMLVGESGIPGHASLELKTPEDCAHILDCSVNLNGPTLFHSKRVCRILVISTYLFSHHGILRIRV